MGSRGASCESLAHVPVNGIGSKLSVRQWHVAELAAQGYSNREIALELNLTEQIVKNVLHSVFDKLGVWNRVELANRFARSMEAGIEAETENRVGLKASEQLRANLEPLPVPKLVAVADTGMELRDLREDPEFPFRKKRWREEPCAADAFRTLARVFAETPELILQRLVDAATDYCGADSAGISLEETTPQGQRRFRWIAISGSFALFLGGTTPRFFSPCGITLSSGRAQLYRVGLDYYDFLGVKAEPITDGILIPWRAGEIRGTLWAVSHRYREAFDVQDFKLLDGLADFAAMAVENRRQAGKL